ncbi:unnamed protein product [Ilex paraguariensis]|uniref:Peptidase M16 N-terminal domain-containing protein n=1 Tax=Ilex paraguariensis TaxID=185542 RepID=A0ABC8TDN2_9AQUA
MYDELAWLGPNVQFWGCKLCNFKCSCYRIIIIWGLFTWLIGEQSSSLPPLDIPLAGVSLPPPLPDYVEATKTKITTLPNGIIIASEISPSPTASIGLYVDCGSIYETPLSTGATHLLEWMAFKSTKNRSHLRIVREVEAIGGHVMASADWD